MSQMSLINLIEPGGGGGEDPFLFRALACLCSPDPDLLPDELTFHSFL